MTNPLVSCVMPTYNRRPFIKAAVKCFINQTYINKELIILDDGKDKIGDLIPNLPTIRYIPVDGKLILGDKRNVINSYANGDIICHFDDDDWSAVRRLEDHISNLESSGRPVTGYKNMLYWDTTQNTAKRYIGFINNYVVGMSLCYRKSYWEAHHFKSMQCGSDGEFIMEAIKQKESLVYASPHYGMMVGRIHGNNVSPKDGVKQILSINSLPKAFWDNESLIMV